MQGPGTLYFFVDDFGRSYYKDAGGNLQLSATPKPIEFAPDGWQKASIENNRNSKYFGLDRTISIPFTFVEDGAFILKSLYYTKGVNAKCSLIILRQKLFFDDNDFGFYYKGLFKGAIDWNNFSHVGPGVTVNVIEDGLLKYIKANENTVYEIPVDVPEMKLIKMDGIAFSYFSEFLTEGVFEHKTFLDANIRSLTLPFVNIKKETSDAFLYLNDQFVFQDVGNLNDANNFNYILLANDDVQLQFKLNLKFTLNTNGASRSSQFFIRYHISGVGTTTIETINLPERSSTQSFDKSYDLTLNLLKDQRVFLFVYMETQPRAFNTNSQTTLTIDESISIVQYRKAYKTTYVKALDLFYVFDKLVKIMTGGKYSGSSDLLLNQYKNYLLTCGDALRSIDGSVLKIRFSDLFQSINCWANVGLRPELTKLALAEKRDIIYSNDPIHLGSVSKMKVSTATNYVYNKFKVGYNDFDYEDVNGRDEFNCSFNFSLAESLVNKEFELISPIRGDSYGAEFTRLNLEGKSTTDGKTDNDTWCIVVNETPVVDPDKTFYTIKRTLNATTEGSINGETIFNLDISPRRNFNKHAYWVHSHFFNQEGDIIVFNTAKKNGKLKELINNIIVHQENANIRVGNLEAPITVPLIFEVDCPAPEDYIDLLDSNPARIISFDYLGKTYKGIQEKTTASAEEFSNETFRLLALYDNDFSSLIDIYE